MSFATIILLVFSLIFALILPLGYFIFNILPFFFSGVFYVPTRRETVKKMVELAHIKEGEKAVDLGSGDGRMVIALAKAGVEAHGYEINPFLVWLSRWNIKRAKLQHKAFIHQQSLWSADLSPFNIVVIYGITMMMKKLEKKLEKELTSGSRVISIAFLFPQWKVLEKNGSAYLYKT